MATLAMAALLGGGGCTICPDPFDYSGPVPDGSPPQNDFRARSGGILPLGAAPQPWPPVVKDGTRVPEGGPTLADPEEVQVVDDPDASMLQQTGGAMAEADTSSNEDTADFGPGRETGPEEAVPALSPVPATAPAFDSVDGDDRGDGKPVAVEQPFHNVPVETPGWRARRGSG